MSRSADRRREALLLPTLGAAAGAPVSAAGAYELLRPLSVGVTYGAIPEFGAGHLSPGQAVHSQLQELLRQSGTRANLDELIGEGKDPHSAVVRLRRLSGKKSLDTVLTPALARKLLPANYDVMVDTGLGALTSAGIFPEYSKQLRKSFDRLPGVSRGGHVMLTPDPGIAGVPLLSYSAGGGKELGRHSQLSKLLPDTLLSFGPRLLSNTSAPTVKERNLSLEAHPFLRPTESRLPGSREELLRRLIGVSERQLAETKLSPALLGSYRRNIARLQEAHTQGKRIISVVGSGRGDAVAIRAMKLIKEMTPKERANTTIVAALGKSDAYSPLAKLIRRLPGVVAFGALPNELYRGLQGFSDLTLGSTGASSLFESLQLPSPVVFPGSGSKQIREELELARSLAARRPNSQFARRYAQMREQLLGQFSQAAQHLDEWNVGSRELAQNIGAQRGVLLSDDPRQALQLMQTGREGAAARATASVAEHGSARARGAAALTEIVRRAKLQKLLGGSALAALGILPAGYLAGSWLKNRKKASSYWTGFLTKCAEAGLDEETACKLAQFGIEQVPGSPLSNSVGRAGGQPELVPGNPASAPKAGKLGTLFKAPAVGGAGAVTGGQNAGQGTATRNTPNPAVN